MQHRYSFDITTVRRGTAGLLLCTCLWVPMVQAAENTGPSAEASQTSARIQTARGVLEASQTAKLAAGLSARVLKAPYRPGQHFRRGALLVAFDCSRQKARKTALEAARQAARLKLDNMNELLAAGAAGELEVTLARAELQQAEAELGVVKAELKDCRIYAPYAGVVKQRHINVYDTPPINTVVYTILRDSPPKIKLIVPSAWLAWIKPGTPFSFVVDETGTQYPAKIVRSGASVDPVSQTIELTARFTRPARGALAGMSGVARFETLKEEAGK